MTACFMCFCFVGGSYKVFVLGVECGLVWYLAV